MFWEYLLSFYLLVTILFCFINIKWCIALYMFYTIVVPFVVFFSIGSNVFNFLILLSLVYNYGIKGLNFKPLMPFVIFFFLQLFIIPFHDKVSFFYQLDRFRVDVMSSLILPLSLVTVMKKDITSIKLFFNVLCLAIICAVCYTIFLTRLEGLNPYMLMILPLSGNEFNDAYSLAEDGGRVFGRISGIFAHPMTNGLFLCLSFVFVLSKINFKYFYQNKFQIFSLVVILFAIFIIGVRSAIGALVISVFLFLLIERKIKLLFFSLLLLSLFLVMIVQIPGMEDFVLSIVDEKSDNVNGSSIEMRISQLESAFNEIRYNILFGNGYGWTKLYETTIGLHPKMLAFESLFIVVLCNNGIFGVIIWLFTIFLYTKNISYRFNSTSSNVLFILIFTYISYSLITGEYGYLKYFLVFYSVIYYDQLKLNQNKLPNNYIK